MVLFTVEKVNKHENKMRFTSTMMGDNVTLPLLNPTRVILDPIVNTDCVPPILHVDNMIGRSPRGIILGSPSTALMFLSPGAQLMIANAPFESPASRKVVGDFVVWSSGVLKSKNRRDLTGAGSDEDLQRLLNDNGCPAYV